MVFRNVIPSPPLGRSFVFSQSCVQVSEDSSIDSEDDYYSGSQNVSHQQQFFWRLLLVLLRIL